MSLLPGIHSATWPAQVLVSGRVVDRLSGIAPAGQAIVRLLDADTNQDTPLAGRVLSDGSFAFYGVPAQAFPLLSRRNVRLRVEAVAPGYKASTVEFEIASVAGQPALVTRPVPLPGIEDIEAELFTGDPADPSTLPLGGLLLTLDREPVRLRGRVVVSNEPGTPVAGATLRLVPANGMPDATTDARGRFEFPDPLPVVLSVQVQASAGGFQDNTITHEADTTRPINTVTIGLRPA